MAEKLTIDSLIQDLQGLSASVDIGKFSFKELSVKQQRRVYISNASTFEIPAKLSNIYNQYIDESVQATDDVARLGSYITVEQRPFFLIVLRAISMGNTYVDKEGKEYSIYQPTPEDFEPHTHPTTIKRGSATIHLRVPTLDVDKMYNAQLINALSPYRKKNPENMMEGDITAISDLYQVYEVLKYIEKIDFNGKEYIFDALPVSDKMRVLDAFPESIQKEISDYIIKVNQSDKKAFAVTSLETGEVVELDAPRLFVSRTKNSLDLEE